MTDQDDKNDKIVEKLEDVPMGLLAPIAVPGIVLGLVAAGAALFFFSRSKSTRRQNN
jgi:hypothetical protein